MIKKMKSMQGLTKYKIVYEIANRVKHEEIWAASPMLAFKKWKSMLPEIVLKNSSVHNIEEIKEKTKNKTIKLCYPPELLIRQIG
jgi:hypothetical protein